MNKYELRLKNEKIKSYDRIALFIIVINLSLFVLFAIQSFGKKLWALWLAGAIALLTLLSIQFFLKATKNDKNNIYSNVCLSIAAVIWVMMDLWWAGIICFLLVLLYQIAKKPLLVLFNAETIKYTSFPVRSIEWSDLNNAILKDGLLTIDFKNNKILQAEIEDTMNTVNEKEFNDFCRQQLKMREKSNKVT